MRIRQIGDPILKEVSKAVSVDEIGTADITKLISRMKEYLDGIKAISNDNGNALSAPQVGRLQRLIVLRIDGKFHTMINPEFTPASDQTFEFEEECFSLYDQRATLQRFYQGEVVYLDENATRCTQTLSGEDAGLVQHEIDHLDGILFLDRLKQMGRKATPVDEILREQPERLSQVKKMMDYMVG